MKIATGSDWRDAIPFETPVIVAEVIPGEPTRCAVCGVDSEPLPRTELWAYKHQHPKNHDGYVRFYCVAHVPAARKPEPVTEVRRAPTRSASRSSGAGRTSTSRPAPSDVVRAMCPDCFIEVSALGICGNCGQKVA